MTEAALSLAHAPTDSLMNRRTASASEAVSASTSSTETKRRSKSSESAANSENVSGGSNATKAAASTSAIHQNHPENLCRYPNKRCYNKRAVKNNGELHKFCDTHRDSANRYQRKLEQRLKEKRIQSRVRALQAQQAQDQAHAQAQLAHHAPFGVVDPTIMSPANQVLVSPYPGMEIYGGAATHVPSGAISGGVAPAAFPGHTAAIAGGTSVSGGNTPTGLWGQEYEPFQHPVQLQSEDLDCLYLLFLEQ
ncbi:hypothetical protein PF011_g11164 [Phytophthora fragariae]|uniref:Uncharacterized protein n=1 Tax=Phytophthora fragariae TaxID=53985 RepID=A0A6A3KPL8_9STRA|nr:hypothetical protein PF011_g11164 [Phytophthora fragariae]